MKSAMDLSVEATRARNEKRQRQRLESGGYAATAAFAALNAERQLVRRLADHIRGQLEERSTGLTVMLRGVGPDKLALATLAVLMDVPPIRRDHRRRDELDSIRDARRLGRNIGRLVQGELWAADLLRTRRALLKRISKLPPRQRVVALRRIDWEDRDWPEKQVLQAGTWLLDCCLQAMPDVFGRYRESRRGPGVIYDIDVIHTRLDAAELATLRERVMGANPVIFPCTSEPKPWTDWRDGGYWDERTRFSVAFVRTHYKDTEREIRAAFADPDGVFMKQHVAGVNALRSVPFRINEPVLEAAKRYVPLIMEAKIAKWKTELGAAKRHLASVTEALPYGPLTKEDTQRHRDAKERLSDAKKGLRATKHQRDLAAVDLQTAERFKGAPFYVPLSCDKRGRVFGIPHFNFQREDHVRGLFLFDRGLRLGDNLGALQIHTATCGGAICGGGKIDKQSFLARAFWATARRDLIERTARLETLEWLDADKPFQFLAACLELTAAWKNGPDYVTHLPITFDCSCSGLQHLCAMMRSEEGEQVNLRWKWDHVPFVDDQGNDQGCTDEQAQQILAGIHRELVMHILCGIPLNEQADLSPDDQVGQAVAGLLLPPEDIYAVVARKVEALVKDDTELRDIVEQRGITIDRKLVKQPVMTFCYGVTEHGVIDQIKEELAERGQRLEWELLKRLCDHVWGAVVGTVRKAEEARKFLQLLARVLADKNEVLQWTTPTGFPWANRYHVSKTEVVSLILTGHRVQWSVADGHERKVRKKKAVDSVVANVVHALDVSHMLRTVNACVEAGINDLVTVHDSFGCLAPQAHQFNRIVREEFERMYKECDPLRELRDRALCKLGPLAPQLLDPVPERGSLDLSEISKSPYPLH
jgi:DNA-directed RNA polymerase, mitochondrial